MKLITNAAVLRICLGLCVLVGGIVFFLSRITGRDSLKTPLQSVFTAETDISVADDWQLLDSGDEHGGFTGDGETHFVFHVPKVAIDELLASRPPWSKTWTAGPVPHEIGFHCFFGTDGVAYSSGDGRPNEYLGEPKLVTLLSSQDIHYDAKERCCDSLRWHNGHLLVIDPNSSTIWLSIWDF